MRPLTPTAINVARTEPNITSPPETPTAGSPGLNRKFGAASDHHAKHVRGRSRHSSRPPLGGVGSQFSNTLGFRPEEISPQSSNSSDNESEKSVSPPRSTLSDDLYHIRPSSISRFIRTHVVEDAFEIEECSDYDEDAMDSGDEYDDDVLRPYSVECPSDRSRSRSVQHEVDPQLMDSLQDLKTCYSDSDSNLEGSDDDDDDGGEFERIRKLLRQQRRVRRMTSGSISKRTVSERDSDSDREDLQPWDTGDSHLRRLRRKINRRSLISNPAEIIIELKEPNSDGEVVWDEDEINLARELPFWTMEVDSD
ncbi:hypothetical protein LQW54_002698 [Pestalotiopsis sp. IQ-011]